MRYFIASIIIINLVFIAYQDHKSRSVNWVFFPLLAIVGFLSGVIETGSPALLFKFLLINLSFLLTQFVVLKLYFTFRSKKNARLIDNKLGSGDILFLVAASFFFSPANFIVFYLLSLFFTLIVYVAYSTYKRINLNSIPLAGLQSIFFICCIFISLVLKYSLLNDNWVIIKIVN
jgi:Flp pilus assembly protein protease CpaA